MKTNEKTTSVNSLVTNQNETNRTTLRLSLLIILLAVFLVPFNAMASRQRLVLDFNDTHMRGHQGEPATIMLKKSIKSQYPWIRISELDLRRVKLVAKSKRGRGGAALRVGNWGTDMYEVAGSPQDFHDGRRITFDKVKFNNPSHNSHGPWQLDLKGNFIVRKVVLEVEDHSRRRHHRRWNRHER